MSQEKFPLVFSPLDVALLEDFIASLENQELEIVLKRVSVNFNIVTKIQAEG